MCGICVFPSASINFIEKILFQISTNISMQFVWERHVPINWYYTIYDIYDESSVYYLRGCNVIHIISNTHMRSKN